MTGRHHALTRSVQASQQQLSPGARRGFFFQPSFPRNGVDRVPSKSSVSRWRVTVIAGSRGREVCELQAESAEAAIKRAIREHGIENPERQKRLGAYRVG